MDQLWHGRRFFPGWHHQPLTGKLGGRAAAPQVMRSRSALEYAPSGGLDVWSLTLQKSLCYGQPLFIRTVSEEFPLWRLKKI